MYMPGAFRTGSKPSRKVMSAAVYLDLAIDESARREPLPSLLPNRSDASALHHLEPLAGAASRGDFADGELALAPFGGRCHQRGPPCGRQRADDSIVVTSRPHQVDAFSRTRKLRHLV